MIRSVQMHAGWAGDLPLLVGDGGSGFGGALDYVHRSEVLANRRLHLLVMGALALVEELDLHVLDAQISCLQQL